MRNDEKRRRAKDLFLDALEQEPSERRRFLDEVCGENRALRLEIESLLRAHSRAGEFLKHPALDGDPPGPFTDIEEIIGQRVGAYRIVRLLGTGGMGTVYLGELDDDEFSKQVGVKLIKRGMDTDSILRRLRHERQVLADLEHPNIARLVDGGATDDGLPYLIMEYVDGLPIDQHCRDNALSIEERLTLFRTVCDTVHYAHQRLIVHRDLKPNNILVDRDGRVKLLDFGIAKVLDSESPDLTTVDGPARSQPLTPRYASPEQIRGGAITTAADVYSLGVVLYELLTGHPPHDVASSTPAEVRSIVCERDPAKPSIAAASAVGGSARLARRLSGDLDNVILKALRKEPGRRYASAKQLSDDIRRHQDGLPIRARADTLGYRTRKFVRRNAVAVGAAALLFVAMTGAAVVSTVLYVQSKRANDRAVAAQRDAESQRETAQEITEYLKNMFEAVDPDATQERTDVTARQVLETAAARINAELADRPAIAAELHHTIGTAYKNLALFDEALMRYANALDIQRSIHDGPHADIVGCLLSVANIHTRKARYPEAQSILDEALEMSRALDDGSRGLLARSIQAKAKLRFAEGVFAEAESLYRETVDLYRSASEPSKYDISHALHDLALTLRERGDYAESEAILRNAVAMLREEIGNNHTDIAHMLNSLGWILEASGNGAQSVPLVREALAIFEAVYDDDHPKVMMTRTNLAMMLRNEGQYEEAIAFQRESVKVWRDRYGPDHPYVGHALNNLALALDESGDPAAAVPELEECIRIYQSTLGEDHAFVGIAIYNLANALRDLGYDEAAEARARTSLGIRRRALREGHPDIARSLQLIAELMMARGRNEAALPLIEEAFEIRQAALGPTHGFTGSTGRSLGECLYALGRYTAAEPHLLNSHALFDSTRGPDDELTRKAAEALISLYDAWGKPERAVDLRARQPSSREG